MHHFWALRAIPRQGRYGQSPISPFLANLILKLCMLSFLDFEVWYKTHWLIYIPKIVKIGLYLMTQHSVKVASGPLQARNYLFRFISLKISSVPHTSCDGTNYLTLGIKMTNFSYCTIFISLHGFKAELLTCKNVRAVTICPPNKSDEIVFD